MNTATHPVAPEEVMAFLDGELSAAQSQSVFEHVKHCADCSSLAAEFSATQRQLAAWRADTVPGRVELAVLERLEEQSARRGSLWWSGFWKVPKRSRLRIALASGCALAAVMLFALIAGRSYRANRIAGLAGPQPSSGTVATLSVGGNFTRKVEPPRNKAVAEYEALLDKKRELAMNSSLSVDGAEAIGRGENGSGDTSEEDAHPAADIRQPMIARTVSLTIVAKDFAASRAQLDAILARHHGYAAQLTANTAENAARSVTASLRVPAGELATAVNELKGLGHVESESQSGEEVTQQHADLVARLRNSRETEVRLQAILQQRTGKIADVLAVEQEMSRIRGEIEQMEAEQKALEHRVNFATIELNLNEEYKAQLDSSTPSVSTRLHNALVNGFQHAAESLLGLVLFFVEAGPTFLLWAIILVLPAFLLIRRYRRAVAAA